MVRSGLKGRGVLTHETGVHRRQSGTSVFLVSGFVLLCGGCRLLGDAQRTRVDIFVRKEVIVHADQAEADVLVQGVSVSPQSILGRVQAKEALGEDEETVRIYTKAQREGEASGNDVGSVK